MNQLFVKRFARESRRSLAKEIFAMGCLTMITQLMVNAVFGKVAERLADTLVKKILGLFSRFIK
jgi:hypothetical protein